MLNVYRVCSLRSVIATSWYNQCMRCRFVLLGYQSC